MAAECGSLATSVSKAMVEEISELLKKFKASLVGNSGRSHYRSYGPYQEVVHFCGKGFDVLGLIVIVIAAFGLLRELFFTIIPFMMWEDEKCHKENHVGWLKTRMRFTRGLILGLDLMVASDVIETLLSEVDLLKLFFIMAARSWLGFERTREFAAMDKETREEDRKSRRASDKKEN